MEPEIQPPPPPPPPPELPDQQPPHKKPKMSSTTTTSDEETTTTSPKPLRLKRRKVAIFFAYCGVGYQGMQKNPGAKTIEGDLEEALFFAGAIPEADRGQSKRFDWARSARTDKGVSAVGQVVSGRFYVDQPGFLQQLNSHLPPQIRIFGYKRATPSFNAKKFCDRRRYVYLLPVFALDSSCHRDRESVLASLGSDNELSKCLGCSERGRKVAGLMGNRKDWENSGVVHSGISSNSCDALLVSPNNDGDEKENNDGVAGESSNDGDGLVGSEVKVVENDGVVDDEERKEMKSDFKYGEEERKRFNRILKYYEGTHNFHNFTTRTKAEDPAAKRYIVSFEANTVLTLEGMEFVKCEVIGQSFMLHQIRKMIGLAVAVMRDFVPESIYERAFDQDFQINVPTAPEVGLFLDECLFTSYNNKWKNTHEEISMKDYAEEAEEFKLKYIYSHVANTEQKEGSVAVWLHSLNHRNYPDFRPSNDEAERGASDEGERTANDKVENVVNDELEKVAVDEMEKAADDNVGSVLGETADYGKVASASLDKVKRDAAVELKKMAEVETIDVIP